MAALSEAVRFPEGVRINIIPLAERMLDEMIRRNPETYGAATGALDPDQAYYLNDEALVLLFDESRLTHGAEGVSRLDIRLDRVSYVMITEVEYSVWPGYNVKMIPFRMVCGALGYDMDWEPAIRRVTVVRDGMPLMEMTINVNNYSLPDKKTRALEVAPMIMNDMVYVPISFFEQILSNVTYSIDPVNNITFLAYRDSAY
jgi:hypothetical protein